VVLVVLLRVARTLSIALPDGARHPDVAPGDPWMDISGEITIVDPGEGGEDDTSAILALGATATRLLTGIAPLEDGATPQEHARWVSDACDQITEVVEAQGLRPTHVVALLRNMLALEPTTRPTPLQVAEEAEWLRDLVSGPTPCDWAREEVLPRVREGFPAGPSRDERGAAHPGNPARSAQQPPVSCDPLEATFTGRFHQEEEAPDAGGEEPGGEDQEADEGELVPEAGGAPTDPLEPGIMIPPEPQAQPGTQPPEEPTGPASAPRESPRTAGLEQDRPPAPAPEEDPPPTQAQTSGEEIAAGRSEHPPGTAVPRGTRPRRAAPGTDSPRTVAPSGTTCPARA